MARRPRLRFARFHPQGLVARLLTAQVAVIGIGALALVATAAVVGPRLFAEHLARTGEDSPMVTEHATQAFTSAFGIAIAVSLIVSLLVAGLVAVVFVRRVAAGVVDLADAADAIAAGRFDVAVPLGGFGTEMTRLSAAFALMADRLAASEAARTSMLADLSHELRTPLATLEAYVDGMEDGVVPSEPGSYAVMRDQVGRLRRLAVDVREASAAEEHSLVLHPEPVHPAALAASAVGFARPAFTAKGVDLALDSRPGCPQVAADPVRMAQVLGNLLANALRHTQPGGHVRVSTGPGREGDALIVVADDGEGIPAGQLEAVFTRFHRVDASRASQDGSGSGLGLTIARAIVTSHGGSLTADSPGLGRGSVFTVRLPAQR
jgi:two-component system, OmpR family, sensor histidine kinase BaeS